MRTSPLVREGHPGIHHRACGRWLPHVAQYQRPAFSENAPHLKRRAIWVGIVMERIVAYHKVEDSIMKGQTLRIGLADLCPARKARSRTLYHGGRKIDAGKAAGRQRA